MYIQIIFLMKKTSYKNKNYYLNTIDGNKRTIFVDIKKY